MGRERRAAAVGRRRETGHHLGLPVAGVSGRRSRVAPINTGRLPVRGWFLARDRIGSRRVIDVSPAVLSAAITAWRADGWTDPTVWARVRALRSALGWAHVERILDRHPLEGVQGPPQPGCVARPGRAGPRHPGPRTTAGHRGSARDGRGPAADSGARRGELAALQLGDLDGDILTIARAASNEVVGPTKSGLIRRLTLGPTTAAQWLHTVTQWRHADALIRTYRPVATPPAGRGRNDVCGHDGGRSRTQLRCARRRHSAAAPVMITNPTTATIKPTAAEPLRESTKPISRAGSPSSTGTSTANGEHAPGVVVTSAPTGRDVNWFRAGDTGQTAPATTAGSR